MHDTKSRAIVLAGNQNFTAQLSTTIKSIFYHNKDGGKIYVLNRDILPDWFRKPRRMAQLLGGELIDVKLNPDDVRDTWWTQEHISLDAYSRYVYSEVYLRGKGAVSRCGFAGSKELRGYL